ncbi:hypothetical protein HMPREF9435_1320 [Gardnerella vaginalis 315-A]|uniref:Uncharacterized protein n=1 Tax=Gardnerella vaginalis JCP8108 TaxID=1261066 RepID=S4GZM2_GARVA|nr:hypothetical protein HMPREF9435_1320 [Gardnerella vaginalis 315-A]EPI48700.1 hypothetical protein HMPREF1581_00575 [Gardnerella vaginalis JCP8108]EPI49660.1 hypothetical protein HMPREF1575_01400 [Gardnerella vaginalis JCP7672]
MPVLNISLINLRGKICGRLYEKRESTGIMAILLERNEEYA